MGDRGEYRAVYTSLKDDPDFHALSGNAAKLMWILKMQLNAAGIEVVYPLTLAQQVGVDLAELERCMVELEAPKDGGLGWIVRERNVVWIVNGLMYEPNLRSNLPKHRIFVQRLIKPLGTRPITRAFREYYAQWFDDVPNGAPKGKVSNTHYIGIEYLSNHIAVASDIAKPITKASDSDKTESILARWLARFYGDATAERQAEVRAQLAALWKGESVKLKHVPVKAKDTDHLTRKAAEMIEVGFTIRDRSKAIVILLQKLADPEKDANGNLPGEARALELKREEKRADAWETARKKAAAEWEATYPAQAAAIEAEVRASMTTNENDVNYQLEVNIRKVELIIERLGFPDFEHWEQQRRAS